MQTPGHFSSGSGSQNSGSGSHNSGSGKENFEEISYFKMEAEETEFSNLFPCKMWNIRQ